jgi:hypothetical protein
MMNLLMSDLTKKMVSSNPFQKLLEEPNIDHTLRMILYTRFLKTYSKPTKMFQNLNDSLSLISMVLDILRVDRLTFYELSHSRDQKLVIYNLLFEYLRILCIDNPKVKNHILNLMGKFIESIEPGGEIFMKYLCFFEEFSAENLDVLKRGEVVRNYTDTILSWICQEDSLFTSQSAFLFGMLPRLLVFNGIPIKDNQQVVLRCLFNSKYTNVIGQLRGTKLDVLLRTAATEGKDELYEFEDSHNFRIIVVRDIRIRVLCAYFNALRACIEKGNPLLRKFCQNLYSLDFFKKSLSFKLPLEFKLSIIYFLEELFLVDMDGPRLTVHFIINELFDEVI